MSPRMKSDPVNRQNLHNYAKCVFFEGFRETMLGP